MKLIDDIHNENHTHMILIGNFSYLIRIHKNCFRIKLKGFGRIVLFDILNKSLNYRASYCKYMKYFVNIYEWRSQR